MPNTLSLVVTSQRKSSDKSLVTFQSLSSCCSVDLYFSRLEVTGRGTDTCELGKDLNSCPKIMVLSKDWPCKQRLNPRPGPRLVGLCPSSHLLPYFCHKSSLFFRDHLRSSCTICPMSWGDPFFPLCPPQGGSGGLLGVQPGADWHPDIASAPKGTEIPHCWEVPAQITQIAMQNIAKNYDDPILGMGC